MLPRARRNERRRGGNVPIVVVVLEELIERLQRSVARIECDHRIRIQIASRPHAGNEVGRGIASGRIHDPGCRVERVRRPRRATGFRKALRSLRPCLRRLSILGHQLEAPDAAAGFRVKRHQPSLHGKVVAAGVSHEHHPVPRDRCSGKRLPRCGVAGDRAPELLARGGIERHHATIVRSAEESRAIRSREIREATIHLVRIERRLRIVVIAVPPAQRARGCIDRVCIRRRREVERSRHRDDSGLQVGLRAERECAGGSESRHVGCGDLRERREARAIVAAIVHRPVRIGTHGLARRTRCGERSSSRRGARAFLARHRCRLEEDEIRAPARGYEHEERNARAHRERANGLPERLRFHVPTSARCSRRELSRRRNSELAIWRPVAIA